MTVVKFELAYSVHYTYFVLFYFVGYKLTKEFDLKMIQFLEKTVFLVMLSYYCVGQDNGRWNKSVTTNDNIATLIANSTSLTPEPSSTTEDDTRTIFVIILSVTIFLILSSNTLVIVTILKSRALREANYYIFLLSLVVARTSIGAFVVPSGIAMFYSEEALGRYFCKICHYCGGTSAAASIFTIIVIALDNLRSSLFPDKHTLTKRQVAFTLATVWVCALAYGVRMLVIYDMILVSKPDQPIKYSCHFNHQYAEVTRCMVIVDFVILYTIPLCVIVFTYGNVVSKLKKKISANELDKDVAKRVIQMLTVLMLLFAFCNLPAEIFRLYRSYGGKTFAESRTVSLSFSTLSFSNSWINVIVFFIYREDLRRKCKEMFGITERKDIYKEEKDVR